MTDIPGTEFEPPLSSFQWPTALPTGDPDAAPLIHVCFSEDWLALILGSLKQLTQGQIWETDDPSALSLTLERVDTLLDMFQGECPLIPPGTVVAYAGSTTPDEWLLCDGSAVSRADYAALFTAIGTTYGPGDGTTTFNLPDLESRVIVGSGAGAGLSSYSNGDTGGEETHTLSGTEVPTHSHIDAGHTHTEGNAIPAVGAAIVGVPIPSAVPGLGVTGIGNASIGNSGGGGSHNNLQPFVALTYLIKT